MQKQTTKKLARLGLISAIYVILCLIAFPVASGAIQIRIGECLTLLPLFIPESYISLFIGCILINVITGCAIFDIILGSLITLVAGVLTAFAGKIIKNTFLKVLVGGVFPVLLNALILPIVWFFAYGKVQYVYILQVLFLLLGQAIAVYGIGSLLVVSITKLPSDNKFFK